MNANEPNTTKPSQQTERIAYSIPEAADMLGLDYFSVYRLVQRGKLKACRALRGSMLRQEVYALDGTEAADRPYTTSEHNYTIEVFQPQGPNANNGLASARANSHRNREFLEGFSLDTLKMVGTFKVGNNFYGLVQSKDGLVHKVQPGNYLGQNDGKVTEITGGKISLVEIIPDGLGGYIERPASLALTD